MPGKTDKREQIIQSSAELVHINGFNNTSVSDILEKAGIGKGQFYHYFHSKEELGYAVIDYQFSVWNDLILSKAFQTEEIRGLARIRRVMDLLIELFRQVGCLGGCPFANLALEMGDIHEGFRKKIEEIFEKTAKHFIHALEEAKEIGEIPPDSDSEVQARTLLAAIEGAIMLMKATKNIGYLEEVFSQVKIQIGIK